MVAEAAANAGSCSSLTRTAPGAATTSGSGAPSDSRVLENPQPLTRSGAETVIEWFVCVVCG